MNGGWGHCPFVGSFWSVIGFLTDGHGLRMSLSFSYYNLLTVIQLFENV